MLRAATRRCANAAVLAASTSAASTHMARLARAMSARQQFPLRHVNKPASACSTATAEAAAGPTWAEHEFTAVAESTLECISEAVAERVYSSGDDSSDVDLSQGVLTASLASHGVYVINTQTPNRQIWLSSPVSGPWRYAWHPRARVWRSTRDGHTLSDLLVTELREVFGEKFSIDFGALERTLDELPG